MKNILVIFKKQMMDTFKNRAVLIQFVLFPVMTLIMEKTIHMEDMPEYFFAKLFSSMYMGMAPLVATTSIIAEEKEKNTLRVLMMSNVKPWQYLIGVGSYVWAICMLGAAVISTTLPSEDIPFFMAMMGTGIIISIVAGAAIGVYSNNQMSATSISTALMMVLSFLPMISMFNDSVKKFAKIFYTQQIRLSLDTMSFTDLSSDGMIIIVLNAVLAVVLFSVIFKKKGLE